MNMGRLWRKSSDAVAEKEEISEMMVGENGNDGAEENEVERCMELAIPCHRNALTVFTGDSALSDWVLAKLNLAEALQDRVAGDRLENAEEAIQCRLDALREMDRANMADLKPAVQMNIGNAWLDRMAGVEEDNIEKAIACYSAGVIDIVSRESQPCVWATGQRNLGDAWQRRIAGVESENLDKAIAC
jgi:hypothetical protein